MSKLKKPILTAALIASLCALHASDNPRALMLQARERQRQGEIEDTRNAAALYRRVLLQVPDSAEAHLRLSECLADLSDLPGATAEAKEVRAYLARLRPWTARAMFSRARRQRS